MQDELRTLEREAKEYLSDEICEATVNLCVLMAKRSARQGEESTSADYAYSVVMSLGPEFLKALTAKLDEVGISVTWQYDGNAIPDDILKDRTMWLNAIKLSWSNQEGEHDA